MERFYARLARGKGKHMAVIATARKLLTYTYQVLKWVGELHQVAGESSESPAK